MSIGMAFNLINDVRWKNVDKKVNIRTSKRCNKIIKFNIINYMMTHISIKFPIRGESSIRLSCHKLMLLPSPRIQINLSLRRCQ